MSYLRFQIMRFKVFLAAKKPLKLFIAFLLRKTGLSRFFIIRKDRYLMKFYPSALLMHYWADSNVREDEVIFLSKLVTLGSTVIDVGANVGTLSLPLSLQIGKSGRLVSIEANPTTFRYLHGNIKLNHNINNITPLNIAVGDTIGEIYFSNIRSDDMNKVVTQNTSGALKIPVTTLDSIIEHQKIKHIRLLKIDIEGYELYALKGAKKVLKMTEIIFFESWEKHFNSFGYSTKDILILLQENNFTVHKQVNEKLIKVDENYISIECENLLAFKNPNDIDTIYEQN